MLTLHRDILRVAAAAALVIVSAASDAYAQSQPSSSVNATWTCTASPCPWGQSLDGQAALWATGTTRRLGYTTSPAVYLPAAHAEGATIEVVSGVASLYAGLPDAPSHRFIATINVGQSHTVTALQSGEMLSLQSSGSFEYVATLPAPPPPVDDPPPPVDDPPPPVDDPPPPPPPAPTSSSSQLVVWTCTGAPCPWGSSDSAHALVWASAGTSQRLGYTVSAGIYLPDTHANGAVIELVSGAASAYAGLPGAPSHRFIGNLAAGQPFTVSGLQSGEVVSVQSGGSFEYRATRPTPAPPADDPPPPVDDPPPPPPPPVDDPPPPAAPSSQLVTWTCTGTPCPWGSSLSGHALVWSAGGTSQRLGYTVSAGVYLPVTHAQGAVIVVQSGVAQAYAGLPGAPSHRFLATLAAGQPYTVSGLQSGEVLGIQSDSSFTYSATLPTPSPGEDPPPDPDPTPDPQPATSSAHVTWSCTGSNCPWGSSMSGDAAVWPAATNPTAVRLGYTVSQNIYLPAAYANGATIQVVTGSAQVYAGLPDAPSHRFLGAIAAGGSFAVEGLHHLEVLSLQGDAAFTYRATLAVPPPSDDPPANVTESVLAFWKCTQPGCTSADWVGQVINWPSWAAYHTNSRAGDSSRAVFNSAGEPLYPYMGSWASGCQVTVVSGRALIIEWQRGTESWRETLLDVGQTYVISLVDPEDGAMIESENYGPGFGVQLDNCDPQPLE